MKRRMQQSDNGSIVAFVLRRKDSVSHEKVQQHECTVGLELMSAQEREHGGVVD